MREQRVEWDTPELFEILLTKHFCNFYFSHFDTITQSFTMFQGIFRIHLPNVSVNMIIIKGAAHACCFLAIVN